MNNHIQGDRESKVKPSVFGYVVVQSGVAHDLGLEPGKHQKRRCRERFQTALNFVSNLIFEKTWVPHQLPVEYKLEGKTSESEVDEVDAD